MAYERFLEFDIQQPIPDEIQNIEDPVPGDTHGRILIDGTVLNVVVGEYRERKVTFKVNHVLLAQKHLVGSTIDVYTPVKDKQGVEFLPGKNYRVYIVPLDPCRIEPLKPAPRFKATSPKCKEHVMYFTWSLLAYEAGPQSTTAFKCRPHNLIHD
ncbi:MAG: hypothetical protein ACAH83_01280 [Alphaproteobacteria bacterium]